MEVLNLNIQPHPIGMSHLSFHERVTISEMRQDGFTRKAIAEHLGRSASTISRELIRNSTRHDRYRALHAQRLARGRRQVPSVVSKLEQFPELLVLVKEKLLLHWSPEQISGWLRVSKSPHQVSHQTIYSFLNSLERKDALRQGMRRRGRRNRRQKPGYIRSQLRDRTSIQDRPKYIERRKRIGDWELDLVRCYRASGYLITAVERKTGFALVRKVASKQSALVMRGILKMFSSIDRVKIKTFTFDNGTEFFFHRWLTEALPVKVYFADPYNSGQRGTNENTNGLLRQYFPKTLNYKYITHQAVAKAQHALNHRPRLRLGFQTPASQFK